MLERELTLADHAPFAKKLSPPRPPGAVTISVGRANRMQTTPPPPALYPSPVLCGVSRAALRQSMSAVRAASVCACNGMPHIGMARVCYAVKRACMFC